MSKSDKIEKIKKLLAKGDKSRNSSEQEAEIAMKMAMSMMDSANISMAEINASSMDDEYGELGHSWLNNGEEKQLHTWKKVLIHSLAYFFDCELVNNPNGRKSKIDIIGRESNRITCEMFYNWIHDRTMKEAKERFGSQTAKRNSYCVGVAQGIKEKVFEIKPKSVSAKNGWGIVPRDEVKNFVHKLYPSLISGKKLVRASDREAYSAGKTVGVNTSLNNQFGLKAICAE